MSFLPSRRACLALPLAAWASTAQAGDREIALVMFERPGCPWCVRWMKDVGATYDRSPEARVAPLKVVDLWANPHHGLKLKEPVRFTPTFVVTERGAEIGRITGYIDNATFWGLYSKLLETVGAAAEKPEPA